MIAQTCESLGGIFPFLLYFVLGQTGFVRKESGFAAAWIVGVLVVGAVLFGTPDRAEAECNPGTYGMDPCTEAGCDMYCRIYRDCWNNACASSTMCECGGFK